MKNLIIFAVLATLIFLGYQKYDDYQQAIQLQQQTVAIFERDKQALQEARNSKDPKALFRFIHQHPDSDWLDSAQYYLEKQLVENALDKKDLHALKSFIQNYPQSEWKQYALGHQQKLIQQQEELQAAALEQATNAAASRKPDTSPVQLEQKSPLQPKHIKQKNNDAQDRVSRALSIYQKINHQKSKQQQQVTQQRQQQAEINQRCNKLKDQLKQFRSNVRWYELDDQGKRVYMDKQTVKHRKKEIQDDIKNYCS